MNSLPSSSVRVPSMPIVSRKNTISHRFPHCPDYLFLLAIFPELLHMKKCVRGECPELGEFTFTLGACKASYFLWHVIITVAPYAIKKECGDLWRLGYSYRLTSSRQEHFNGYLYFTVFGHRLCNPAIGSAVGNRTLLSILSIDIFDLQRAYLFWFLAGRNRAGPTGVDYGGRKKRSQAAGRR